MRHRMKLVVPFSTALRARTLLPRVHSVANASIGVPPPTVPLKRSSTRLWRASSSSAGKATASGPLLTHTTCLPVRNAALSRLRAAVGQATEVGVASITTWASLCAISSTSCTPSSPRDGSAPTVPCRSFAASSASGSRPAASKAAPRESITPTSAGEKPCRA